MPQGWLKRTLVPEPSVLPELPAVPANVETVPLEVTLRTTLLWLSATNTFPLPSTATDVGWLNWAVVPVPSVVPEDPSDPASVVTTPAAVTLRITWLFLSATKRLPLESSASPYGWLKRAAVPVPSTEPDMLGAPANAANVYGVA